MKMLPLHAEYISYKAVESKNNEFVITFQFTEEHPHVCSISFRNNIKQHGTIEKLSVRKLDCCHHEHAFVCYLHTLYYNCLVGKFKKIISRQKLTK